MDVTRDVEEHVQVVAHAAAVVRRDDPVAADAAVPRPVFGHHHVRGVVVRLLPQSEHLRLVAVRGETRRDRRAVLRIVALVVPRHALRDGVADRQDADLLRVVGVVADGEDELQASVARFRGGLARDRVGRSVGDARRVEDFVEVSGEHGVSVLVGEKHDASERHVRIVRRERQLRPRADSQCALGGAMDVDWRRDRIVSETHVFRQGKALDVESALADDDGVFRNRLRRRDLVFDRDGIAFNVDADRVAFHGERVGNGNARNRHARKRVRRKRAA